jgi:hypothetical protein
MTCKYCGRECKSGAGLTSGGNTSCQASPNKKHVLLSDGIHCVFCGGVTKSGGSVLSVGGGTNCPYSPSRRHQLSGDASPVSNSSSSSSSNSSSSGYSGGGAGSLLTVLKLVGIVFVALVTVITVLCYKFPKFLKEKNKKFLYAYIITWVLLIAGAVIYFSFFSPEAVSGIKVKIVSASCETQENFVSLVNESLSGVSVIVLEGEEFTKYSQQAYNAVIERESLLKDSVYFVKLPDNVNVYIWFKTKDQVSGHVYKINKTK